MTDPDLRIPQDHAQEVLAIASRRYAKTVKGYSVSDLIQAGEEVHIPEPFIREAIADVRARQQQRQARQQRLTVQRRVGLGCVAVAALLTTLWGMSTYNALARAESQVHAAWAQVDNQLQRRADLIPPLVRVTQDYANHEEALISMLVDARQRYLDAQTQAEKLRAIATLNQAIDEVETLGDRYPQLQSSQLFINLHYEMAGTENRIAVERMRYIEAVEAYHQKVNQFPSSVVASLFGFESNPDHP